MTEELPKKHETKRVEKKASEAPFASEISSLKTLEESLGAAFEAYGNAKRKRAEGHPSHATHLSHHDIAAKSLGKAHGGVVQAIEALEVFASHEARAHASHAEAEAAKKSKEQVK